MQKVVEKIRFMAYALGMTATTYSTIEFATKMLGLQYDEQTNEFYSIYGEYAKPEFVGTRRIVSEEKILTEMDRCLREY
jgi:hypothetical protein